MCSLGPILPSLPCLQAHLFPPPHQVTRFAYSLPAKGAQKTPTRVDERSISLTLAVDRAVALGHVWLSLPSSEASLIEPAEREVEKAALTRGAASEAASEAAAPSVGGSAYAGSLERAAPGVWKVAVAFGADGGDLVVRW